MSLQETERGVLEYVRQWLSVHGWVVLRIPPAIYGHKGLPDLYACKAGVSVWIEVKTDRGRLSSDQRRTIELLRGQGVPVYVIYGMRGKEGADAQLGAIQDYWWHEQQRLR